MVPTNETSLTVTKINLHSLRNEEHFQFQTELKDSVTLYGAENLKISAAFAVFLLIYAKENEALKVILKSATTQQLIDSDSARDSIFRGFTDAVKSALNHFRDDIRAAASRIIIILDQYGNVARKPYNEETADINKLVEEFQGKYAADIELLGLADWVVELNVRNRDFDALMKDRFSDDATKTQLRVKEVRAEMDAAYHKITKLLDSLMLVYGVTAYEAFVKELNTRVDKYTILVAQRKGLSAKDAAKTNPPAK